MPEIPRFEELDFQKTPLGEVILRRRTVLSLANEEIYEVILGEAFLMSSLFTVVEQELSRLGLAACEKSFPAEKLDVVVGGLGLGYTARAALEFDSVASLRVVDYLKPVIEWFEKELTPLAPELNADGRCSYVHGDFFKLATATKDECSFDVENAERKFHAVLLDIDHSPEHLLHERHGDFYAVEGLRKLVAKIKAGGVFALWSDDPPEAGFMNNLNEVFESCEHHVVPFHNPIQDEWFESTVYVARKAR
jgi:spermidine synthase